ncbi:MAG: HlyD family efflux transporter periplasmic adaptor subunit [Bacillota bacterium]|nr:HlyD family efflux transporter periplasmic adaptor subunit [Bacillota bacterium]
MKDKKKRAARQGFQVLQGEGKKFSFTSFKQAAVFYVLLLLALVVIAQLGYHWLGEQFLAWRLQLVEAEVGEMRQEINVDGVITRHEEVIYAPANVVVLKLAPDGERISAGEELARLGVVSFRDMQALRGSDQEEPDEALWQQLQDYWDNLFSSDDRIDEETESAEAEDSDPEEDDQTQVETGKNYSHEDILVLYNEVPALVSHFTDGLEADTGPYFPENYNLEEENDHEEAEDKEENLKNSGVLVSEGDLIEAGRPLLKLVDNWQWYFNAVLPLHPGRTLAEIEVVNIEFDFAEGESARAELYHSEIDEAAREVRLTYKLEKQLPGFERARFTTASLLYRQQRGIIVPESALFEKDGVTGLYINQGGRVVFRAVTVVDSQNDIVMIEGLEPFSLVITRPDLVEEGQRFR